MKKCSIFSERRVSPHHRLRREMSRPEQNGKSPARTVWLTGRSWIDAFRIGLLQPFGFPRKSGAMDRAADYFPEAAIRAERRVAPPSAPALPLLSFPVVHTVFDRPYVLYPFSSSHSRRSRNSSRNSSVDSSVIQLSPLPTICWLKWSFLSIISSIRSSIVPSEINL